MNRKTGGCFQPGQAQGETAALRETIDWQKKADRCKLSHCLMDDGSYHLALCSDLATSVLVLPSESR